MSRLINIDPQVQLESEPEGYEFRYYTFDTLPELEVTNIENTPNTSVCVNDNNSFTNDLLALPTIVTYCLSYNKRAHFVITY